MVIVVMHQPFLRRVRCVSLDVLLPVVVVVLLLLLAPLEVRGGVVMVLY